MDRSGFLIILLFFYSVFSFAQTTEIKFTKITGTSGVSIGKINAIVQDDYGFLWLSDQTNRCVIRYDGSHMTRYGFNLKEGFSLGGFYPECLFADSLGVLWIGYYGQGLDRFDTRTNTIQHFENDPDDPESLSDNSVTSVIRDHLGQLWVGHYNGVSILDEKTGKFKNYNYDPNDPTGLSHDRVRAIYEDREGTIWVGCGFPWDQNGLGGLNKFDRDQQNFTHYLHDPDDSNSLIRNEVRAIYEDSKGTFWVGTTGDGLHSMNRETGQFTRHTYDPKHPNRLSRSPFQSLVDHITFITEDSENNLWIGTETGGLLRFNRGTELMERFGVQANTASGFTDKSAWTACSTSNGLMYFATQEAGFFRADLKNYTIPIVPLNWFTNEMVRFSDSEIVMASREGLIRRNLNNNSTFIYEHDPRDPTTISNNQVYALIRDVNGLIWTGTLNGLNCLDPKTNQFQRYYHDPLDSMSLTTNDIRALGSDRNGNIWVGFLGQGLYQFNPKTGKATKYKYDPRDVTTIGGDDINVILEEDAEHILLGLANNDGLSRLNVHTGKTERLLPGITITYLYKDSKDIFWLGTPSGLYRRDEVSKNFLRIEEVNEDISITTLIKTIIEDDLRNLWISTPKGLYRIDAKRSNMILLGNENGIYGDGMDQLGHVHKTTDGKLLYSQGYGYYIFDPSELKPIVDHINLYFTRLWVGGKEVLNSEKLEDPIIDAKEINLKYNENVFGISSTAIDYRKNSEVQISYRLNNLDSDWRYADSEERINYYKVPSGNYQFEIRYPISSNGTWVNKSIDINVAKPWWTQWWAYILYAFTFGLLVWRTHLYQRSRLLRAEREKNQQKELEHAREIEKAYTDLKKTQSQLIQSEKMASLGELTAGIAHEIQNPLNFVNNFSDVSAELIDDMEDEIKEGNLNEVKAISTDIKSNLQKISHHGHRASSIVKGMLDHSRNSSDEKELIDINELCDEYLRLSYHGLRARDKSFNANYETDFDKSIPEILVVPQDIGRVLLNIINNAFYAVNKRSLALANGTDTSLGAGGENGYQPQVLIQSKKKNNKIQISIKDNGNGIPKELVDKIFQPFFTTKPTGQGTGLGLSLAYDIITKGHGGELKVLTEEGEGTEFVVDLPLQ